MSKINEVNVSNEVLAYIAGVFDGEGCVSFNRMKENYYIYVCVVNTNLEVLEYIKSVFGGNIQRVMKKKGHKQAYYWRVSWRRAVYFLEKISPWLIVKDYQSHVAFAWDATRLSRKKQDDCERQDYRDGLELLRKELTYLNKKGDGDAGPEPIYVELEKMNASYQV